MPQMHFQPLEMEFNKEKKAVKEVRTPSPYTLTSGCILGVFRGACLGRWAEPTPKELDTFGVVRIE
jgi:hypothetical protein